MHVHRNIAVSDGRVTTNICHEFWHTIYRNKKRFQVLPLTIEFQEQHLRGRITEQIVQYDDMV